MKEQKYGPWLVVFAALLWAVDAPFRKYLTTQLSSTTIVLMEHITIAVLVLVFLWAYFREFKNLTWKEWLAVVFIAFGGSALATVFFTASFSYVHPTVSILLQKVQPFIAILLATVVLKEKLNPKFWWFALLGMLGAYLVSFPAIRPTGFTLAGGSLGALLALGAAFFWGGSTVFGRMVLKKVSFQAMTALRFLGALVFLFLLEVYYGRLGELKTATAKDWQYVFIIAILAGFISLFIYYFGLRSTKASVATICELAFPVAAVVVNWIYLDGALVPMQIVGGVILLAAVLGLSWVNTTIH